ncbi:MAG: glucosamine-6-phosphate isomerase [Bacteroides sp. SM1_62]|nr:MAG: glucosamine-6-phosphate isomerase [Bacteroides sp. SM1_62]
METIFSQVEKSFLKREGNYEMTTRLPYILVENFPKLGLMTSLRFLEWVLENPEGVISLPTGKTPEYFIKYTEFLLENWNKERGEEIRKACGLEGDRKPDLRGLHFVQIDEFYPISPEQHNSFYNYVDHYYMKGFGLDRKRSLLINSDEIPLANGKHHSDVFPDSQVDLSLIYREPKNELEKLQQASILKINDWCQNYEERIREMGGIGFFLGGIGPDGHIAFNTRGSDHHSATRLTPTNFETQAVAAADLGGIEVSRNRLVITIGLETITYNPDAVAIIFAAGEAKAGIVKASLESEPSSKYPATTLQKLPNARFYLTTGAANLLHDRIDLYYRTGPWTHEKTERAVIDLCQKIDKYGDHLVMDDLKNDPYCSLIPGMNEDTVQSVKDSIEAKIMKGIEKEKEQVFYHTGPHHDDIMLGIMPHINRQLREASNEFYFSVLTSGFTAVTNMFIIYLLTDVKRFLNASEIQMTKYPDFFEDGYKLKWDKDVSHYLDNIAAKNDDELKRGISHRMVRAIVDIWKVKSLEKLFFTIDEILSILRKSYDGSQNPPKIQKLKGMVREFEEELIWAHYGVPVKNVHHLRLGFYKGDIFTEQPDRSRDVTPILEAFRKIKPTVISLAFDPEGSGPDTHYKVLQAIAAAVREWGKETDTSKLRIIGYRNVWFRYHPADVNVIVPVSLNSLSIMDQSFTNCYISQVNASFPSYEYDGKFSLLAQRIWVEQLEQLQLLLGKEYFYSNENLLLKATHGLLYFKEMNVEEFIKHARELEKALEGVLL